MDCHRYLLSVLTAKHLDLQYSISKSRPFTVHKLITDESVREFINKDITKSILSKHHQMSASSSSANHPLLHHPLSSSSASHHTQYSINDQFSSSSPNDAVPAADPSIDGLSPFQFTRNLYSDPPDAICTDPHGFTESKRIQNNMSSYTTIDVDTIMCPQCNGQVPGHRYTEHVATCYAATHSYYEQDMRLNVDSALNGHGCDTAECRPSEGTSYSNRHRRKRTFSEMVRVDELLFSTPYRARCVPPNPLELKLEEQSESDIEAVSALCPPDIGDRKKVVAQLIRKEKRFNLGRRGTAKSKGSPPSERKELEVFHKIFTKLVPKEEFSSSPSTDSDDGGHRGDGHLIGGGHQGDGGELVSSTKMEESDDVEEDEDDDDEDSDDDKPIALNLKNSASQSAQQSGPQSPKSPNTYNLRTRSPPKSSLNKGPDGDSPQSASDRTDRSMSMSSSKQSVESTASPLNSRMTKQQKYSEEYREMHRTFKRYYGEHRARERKRRQRMELRMRRNADKLVAEQFGSAHAHFERDRAALDRLYGYLQRESKAMGRRTPLTRYPLSVQRSKDVLDLMLKFKVRAKHCGFVYDGVRPVEGVKEEEEQKTMRMAVDKEEEEEEGRPKGEGAEKEEALQFEYYCHRRLDRKGVCADHGDWRRKRYGELVSRMKEEIEGIFILKCALKHSEGLLAESGRQREMMKAQQDKFAAKELCAAKYDLIGYFSSEDVMDPAVSITVDPSQTDIDLLLQSRFSDAIHRPGAAVENVARNAVVHPNH